MLVGLVTADWPCGTRFHISTKDGALAPVLRGREALTSYKRGIRGDLAAVVACDGLILCGGSHFHDDYHGRRLAYHYVSLLRYTLMLAVARLLGRRTCMLGMGIGPIRKRLARLLTGAALQASHVVTVRDHESLDEVQSLFPRSRAILAFDLAAAGELRSLAAAAHSSIAGRIRNQRVVSVVPVRLSSDSVQSAKYWDAILEGLSQAASPLRPALEILQFSTGGIEGDDALVQHLLITAPTLGGFSSVNLVHVSEDPEVAMARLMGSILVVAGRYHSAVLGYLAERPIVVLPYHQKLKSLATDIGLAWNDHKDMGASATAYAGVFHEALNSPEKFEASLSLKRANELAELSIGEARRLQARVVA